MVIVHFIVKELLLTNESTFRKKFLEIELLAKGVEPMAKGVEPLAEVVGLWSDLVSRERKNIP